jgi:AraC-like DNA-binding protein
MFLNSIIPIPQHIPSGLRGLLIALRIRRPGLETICRGFSISPSTVSRHSGSETEDFISDWLRWKKTGFAVIQDRRASAGVSALNGLSVNMRILPSEKYSPYSDRVEEALLR